jgi:hypothetical protein
VLPVLVAGDAATALPPDLATADFRHVDFRRASRFGFLHGHACDEPLRGRGRAGGRGPAHGFIPGNRRYRRRPILGATVAAPGLGVAALMPSFEHLPALGRPAAINSGGTLEF